MTRLKLIATVIAGQSPPSEDVAPLGNGLPFLQGNAEFGAQNPNARYECDSAPKKCRVGDILLSVRAPVGALNAADVAYGIGRGLCAIRPTSVDVDFLRWALKHMVPELESLSTGSTFGAVTAPVVGNLDIPFPSPAEQRAIADFLDRETARIDTLIAKQEQLIETLRERRAAVIQDAVFGGLQGASRMPTDEPWLLPMPSHWAVAQLGMLSATLAGWAFPSERFTTDSGDVRLLRGANVKPGVLDWSETVRWNRLTNPISAEYELVEGDLVLGMDRPFVGGGVRLAPVLAEDIPALLLQRVMRIRPSEKLDPTYFRYLLSTGSFVSYLEPMFTGVSVPHVSEWQVRKYKMPVPPLVEQREVADYLDRQTVRIDALVAKAETFITLAKERRSALVTAAVTGQIDVRDKAA